jgi:thioredoxin reductase
LSGAAISKTIPDTSLDAVLQLINIASQVYIINVASVLSGDVIMLDKVKENSKVKIFNNTRVREILGEKLVTAIRIEREDQEEKLAVEGVFVEIGLVPNSGFANQLKKNQLGEIKVNCRNQTNVPGIFVAGDVTDMPEKQIVIACGEGSKPVFRRLTI